MMLFATYLAYFASLSLVYLSYFAISRSGFEYAPGAWLFKIVIFAGLAAIACFMITWTRKPVTRFYSSLTLFLLLGPASVLASFGEIENATVFLVFSALLLVLLVASAIKIPAIPIVQLPYAYVVAGSILLVSTYVAVALWSVGLEGLNLNLSKIYQYRAENAVKLPTSYAYLTPNITSVVLPLFLVLALRHKNWVLFDLTLIVTVLVFAITGHKTVIVLPIIAVAIYYISQFKKREQLIALGLVGICLVAYLDFYLRNRYGHDLFGWFGSIILRRGLVMPSQINAHYFEFFSNNPIYLWADSRITLGLVSSPYDVIAQKLIANRMMGLPDGYANAGFIGSGLANGWIFGVVIYSIVFGVVLAIADALVKTHGIGIVLAVTFGPVVKLITSSDVLTCFLTHGLLLALLLLALASLKPAES